MELEGFADVGCLKQSIQNAVWKNELFFVLLEKGERAPVASPRLCLCGRPSQSATDLGAVQSSSLITFAEAGKSKIKVPVGLSEDPFPGP